jgi:hypothetical protein
MLKQVQHNTTAWFWFFVIPNLFLDLFIGFKNLGAKAPPCGRGSLFPQLLPILYTKPKPCIPSVTII